MKVLADYDAKIDAKNRMVMHLGKNMKPGQRFHLRVLKKSKSKFIIKVEAQILVSNED